MGGQAHGHGRFAELNGNTYEGQFDEDRAHGNGKYIHEDGSIYEGAWYKNEKSGQGTETWADGSSYEGGFLQGVKHGAGCYKNSSGDKVFEGQFHEDPSDFRLPWVGPKPINLEPSDNLETA